MKTAESALLLRRLTPADAVDFQALRLFGLQQSPASFASSLEEERDRPLAEIAGRLIASDEQCVFGAFSEARLIGMAGVRRQTLLKYRHKAGIWGVYVHPDQRGSGIGRQLILASIGFAKEMAGVGQLNLTATGGNAAAIALYASLGFVVYGRERDALFAGDVMHDEVHMALSLR